MGNEGEGGGARHRHRTRSDSNAGFSNSGTHEGGRLLRNGLGRVDHGTSIHHLWSNLPFGSSGGDRLTALLVAPGTGRSRFKALERDM